VVEYLHNQPRLKSKTLFATHYHELVELADYLPRVKNFNLAVTEEKGKVIFLRKVIPGGADKSYGIHVGQMAGLPGGVINRAREILNGLESKQLDKRDMGQNIVSETMVVPQLSMFNASNVLLEEIAAIDVDSLSPLEAITKLYGLKKRVKKEQFG
jgi:DNA mismatch repair protein MutS